MSKRRSNEHWSGYSKKYFQQLVQDELESSMNQIPQSVRVSQLNVGHDDVSDEIDPLSEFEVNELNDSSEKVWEDLLSEIEQSHEFGCPLEDDASSELPKCNKKSSLAADLAGFVVRKGRPTRDTTELLHILNDHNLKDLPKTRTNLVKTPKEKIEQRVLSGGGSYYYRGIRKSLEARKHLLVKLDHIVLDVGIDGARVFTSSKLDLWPCMSSIADSVDIRPFLLGCYQGHGKAKNSEEFFEEFEKELLDIYANGIQFEVGGEVIHKRLSIRLFMMDSPARADICKIMSHGSYQGCPFCKFTNKVGGQKNKTANTADDEWKGKVIFPNHIGFSLRTDETFRDRLHPEHHKPEYRTKRSILEDLGFKMISQFPLDPMHIIDLGVVLKGLEFLVKAQNVSSLVIDVDKLSERILAFNHFRPSDFARDVRSLKDLQHFKATELRQFLMYGGIVFLKGLVADHIYDHWLLLHVAVRLLSADTLTGNNIDTAERLLIKYVELYPSIYGEESVTYVVHVLLHITYYSRLYGQLDSFSCYKYENFIQKLKKWLGNANNPLQQISNRIEEEDLFNPDSYIVQDFNKTEIKCDEKDSFIAITIGDQIKPFKVISVYEKNSEKYLAVRRCLNIKNFYTTPIESSAIGEISYDVLDSTIEHYKSSEVVYKYCRIPYNNIFVLMPILHSAFRSFSS